MTAHKGRLFLLGLALFLVIGLPLSLWLLPSSRPNLAETKARLQAAGEKLTRAQLIVSNEAEASLVSLQRALTNFSDVAEWPGSLLAMNAVTSGVAKAASTEAMVPLFGEDSCSWDQLRADIDAAKPGLQQCRLLLEAPPLSTGQFGFTAPYSFTTEWGQAAKWLQGATLLALHDHKTAEALTNLLGLLNAAAVYRQDPALHHQLIRLWISELAVAATWEALLETDWTEVQLAALQQGWEQLDWLKPLTAALEAYRVGGLETFQTLRKNPAGLNVFAGTAKYPLPVLNQLWMKFWADEDELNFLQTMQVMLEADRAALTNQSFQAALPRLPTLKFDTGRCLVSASLLPVTENTVARAARFETVRQLIRVTIALRRYQLVHGQPPAQLKSLLPALLTELPTDYMDGQKLRSRRLPSGQWMFYSVGFNGVDDHGAASPRQYLTTDILWDGPDLVWPEPDQ